MDATKKFLKFNGKNVYFVAVDGTYWIAIKPICESLNVDYEAQRKSLKRDTVLGRVPSEQTVHDASGRLQKMLCIPEKFVYGWIFSIQSQSKELQKYKLKCYEVLYDYFHGSVTGRQDLLKEKALTELELRKLRNRIINNDDYKKLSDLESKQKQIASSLKKMDNEVVQDQINLFSQQ